MDDVGLQALEEIYKVQQIDEPWTIRGERQFSWIGHRLQQTMSASKLFDDEGLTLSRLTASCVVVEDVSAPEDDVLHLLSRLNRHALGNAYSYSAADRRITATTVAYVHRGTLDWRTSQFGVFSIHQLCLAETEADHIADTTGGQVAIRAHPASGFRSARDDMLNVVDAVFVKDGQSPSSFANEFEMQTIAELSAKSSSFASLGASMHGVAFEMAYGETTSLGRLSSEEPHRHIGNGLSYRLHLPGPISPDEAEKISALLNREEAHGVALTTHYGAWCWDTWPTVGQALAYQAFIPNTIYRPGIAQDAAMSLIKRAQWADRFLNSTSSKKNVWTTIAQRFGFDKGESDDN